VAELSLDVGDRFASMDQEARIRVAQRVGFAVAQLSAVRDTCPTSRTSSGTTAPRPPDRRRHGACVEWLSAHGGVLVRNGVREVGDAGGCRAGSAAGGGAELNEDSADHYHDTD
jgi:hypothetical protein